MKRMGSIIALVLASAAAAQSTTFGRRLDRSAEERARLLGQLTHTVISVEMDAVPAHDAFAGLAAAIGAPIMVRTSDDRIGRGIDSAAPITLYVDRASAFDVLEMMVEQCALWEPCTWQLRKGFVEVGTKDRLSAPAALETRTYPVGDFLIEPPYYVGPSLGEIGVGLGGGFGFGGGLMARAGGFGGSGVRPVTDFPDHAYSSASLTWPKELQKAARGHEARKTPDELAREVVDLIVETIEPGNWDYPQETDEDDRPVKGPSARGGRDLTGAVARVRCIDDLLVVRAPDFMHRAIDGYPRAVPPAPIGEDERLRRSAAASAAEGSDVTVLHVTRPPRRRSPPVPAADEHRRIPRKPGEDDNVRRGGGVFFFLATIGAVVQVEAEEPQERRRVLRPLPIRGGDQRARLVRALTAPVSLDVIDTPAREAIARLSRQARVPIVGRFADDPVGTGFDPDLPVTMRARDVTLLDALEQLIALVCPEDEACTWQVRRGFIEVGTKTRLNAPAARERRLYEIADLMMDIPKDVDARTRREVISLDIVEKIVETIEPGAWEYGQDGPLDEEGRLLRNAARPPDAAPGSAPSAPRRTQARRYTPLAAPALIRVWRDVLIVDAPDHIHRQLAGYTALEPATPASR